MQPDPPSDSQLLADWLDRRQDPAFRELVSRYAGLVHMAALRVAGDDALAADAAQLTFILLARKARSLAGRSSLAGWLHHTAVWQARDLLRKARREARKREHFQAAMDADPSPSETWHELSPFLDDALAALSEKDREALLLRFYRALNVYEVAAVLGIAGEAARKRIDRALDRLRGKLARRGVAPGVSLGAVMLAGFANEAQAAGGMVPVLTTKALVAGGGGAVAVGIGSFKIPSSVVITMLVMTAAWIGARSQVLVDLNRQNTALMTNTVDLTVNCDGVGVTLQGRPISAAQSAQRGPIDWVKCIGKMSSNPGVSGQPRMIRLLEDRLLAMTKDEIAAELDIIDKLALSVGQEEALEHFLGSILFAKDTEMAFTWLVSRPNGVLSGLPEFNFDHWIRNDTAGVIAWMDRQIAAGNLAFRTTGLDRGRDCPRNQLEARLIGHLLSTDPIAAERRLLAVPPPMRKYTLSECDLWKLGDEHMKRGAKLAYQLLPASDQAVLLAEPVNSISLNGGRDGIDRYLRTIEAPPAVRGACAERAALAMMERDAKDHQVARHEMDAIRKWIQGHCPESADFVTGRILAEMAAIRFYRSDAPGQTQPSTRTSFASAADMAVAYHDAGGGDAILVELLKNFEATRQREVSLMLASRIRNENLRNDLTRKFQTGQP